MATKNALRHAGLTTLPTSQFEGGDVHILRADDGRIVNAMTVDVEDYFQVSAFEATVARSQWDHFESRVRRNTDRLLEIFADNRVRATFFVLGWVAERHPMLIRDILAGGHELASHGHAHALVYSMSPSRFRDDLRRSRAALEDAGGVPVIGYRAPSFSITRDSLWALDVLIEEGFLYDASIYPIRHDRYGIPDWPRHVSRVVRAAGSIWEIPGSTVAVGGVNLPIGGGGYFRLLPYWWTRRGIQAVNAGENRPTIFYLHPWEIDPEQPRLPASLLSRLRHYANLHETAERLRRLVREVPFSSLGTVLTPVSGAGVAAASA